MAHSNLHLQGLSDSRVSTSQVGVIIGGRYHAWLIFIFLVKTVFHHIGQAGLELLTSSALPTSASRSAGITGMSHSTWPSGGNLNLEHSSIPGQYTVELTHLFSLP